MDIISLKIVVLVLMFFITLVASVLPLAFVRQIRRTTDTNTKTNYQTVLSLLSCVAGGVFMGTCILDLFPDVQAQIKMLLSHYPPEFRAFPVAEFIVVLGFLLVLTMEQSILWCKEQALEVQPTSLLIGPSELRESLQREHSVSGVTDRPDFTASYRSQASSADSDSYHQQVDAADGLANPHLHDHGAVEGVSVHSPFRSLLLLAALSLHSIFEGLAVGLQETIDNVMALFAIVIFHKGIIALSLGLNMVQSRLSVKMIILSALFFALTAPLGVGVGVAVSSLPNTPLVALLSGGLQGLACGTFLYVTFFEVLPNELNNGHLRLVKNVSVILGFAAVCAMMFIEPSQKTS